VPYKFIYIRQAKVTFCYKLFFSMSSHLMFMCLLKDPTCLSLEVCSFSITSVDQLAAIFSFEWFAAVFRLYIDQDS
jgi:hypothetical protein